MQAAIADLEDSKCLATAENSPVTLTVVDRASVDDVATSTNHRAATDDSEQPLCVVDDPDQLLPTPVFNGDDDFKVEKVTPVEANVVLVSRPGDLPQTTRDEPVELVDERSLGNNDNTPVIVRDPTDDNANNVSCQSTRAPRRPRKRSSVCNNVDGDDVFLDVQSDALTTGRKTSVSHQRHADAGDREHRPKRKGNISI